MPVGWRPAQGRLQQAYSRRCRQSARQVDQHGAAMCGGKSAVAAAASTPAGSDDGADIPPDSVLTRPSAHRSFADDPHDQQGAVARFVRAQVQPLVRHHSRETARHLNGPMQHHINCKPCEAPHLLCPVQSSGIVQPQFLATEMGQALRIQLGFAPFAATKGPDGAAAASRFPAFQRPRGESSQPPTTGGPGDQKIWRASNKSTNSTATLKKWRTAVTGSAGGPLTSGMRAQLGAKGLPLSGRLPTEWLFSVAAASASQPDGSKGAKTKLVSPKPSRHIGPSVAAAKSAGASIPFMDANPCVARPTPFARRQKKIRWLG